MNDKKIPLLKVLNYCLGCFAILSVWFSVVDYLVLYGFSFFHLFCFFVFLFMYPYYFSKVFNYIKSKVKDIEENEP